MYQNSRYGGKKIQFLTDAFRHRLLNGLRYIIHNLLARFEYFFFTGGGGGGVDDSKEDFCYGRGDGSESYFWVIIPCKFNKPPPLPHPHFTRVVLSEIHLSIGSNYICLEQILQWFCFIYIIPFHYFHIKAFDIFES